MTMVNKKFPGTDKDGDFDDKSTMPKKKSVLSTMYKDHPKGCDCSACLVKGKE